MRITLVHDWLLNLGGAERVLIELHKIFPKAPIYVLFYNKKFTREYLPDAEIRPSFLQKFPFITRNYKSYAFFMSSAVESLDLSNFDLAISSSVIFSKGLVLKPKTKHICYCYSPTRQIWDNHLEDKKSWIGLIAKHFFRIWDKQASDRVDKFVAISNHVEKRISKYYRREAKIIYPPISLGYQLASELPPRKPRFETNWSLYYLIVSRLYKHKNVDIAIEAFNKLGYKLVIIGDGPEKNKIKNKISKIKNIKLLGFVPDEELKYYYANCKALIMPQEEDFGLTPIEAMSFGKPTLALKRGGALETIIEGVTGEFFDDPIPEALADGVRRLNENYLKYDPEKIRRETERFSVEKFRNSIISLIR